MASENAPKSVLLALKDASTLAVMSYHLERYGFIVNSCRNTDLMNEAINKIEPTVIVYDADLEGNANGKELCAAIKHTPKTRNTNIILVSKDSEYDIKSFDDRVSKPFSPSELVAKIKAFANISMASTQKILSYHDIEMHVNAYKVSRAGQEIHLGPTEFKILQCLIELPGKVLSREHIMNYVWGYSAQVEQRTIDVHINRLRSALKDGGDEVPLIRTIRAAGYSLTAPRELVRS